MRARIEQSLNRVWYGDDKPGLLLTLLEKLYKPLFQVSQAIGRFRRPDELKHKPILVVGNLQAAGSGKTPLVIKICELALQNGLKPGVISRGYGRRTSEPVRVDLNTDPRDSGDEPYLIHQRCRVPVLVERDREQAAISLFNEGVDIVISDDGLQRTRLPRKAEICVIDQARGFGNGRQLPAGPLREDVSRLESVDLVIQNMPGSSQNMLQDGHCMRLVPGDLCGLHDNRRLALPEAQASLGDIHAIAGISNPPRFFEMLKRFSLSVTGHAFPDHHRFRMSDFQSLPRGAAIVMTEKDAVKCRKLPLQNAWYIPVDAILTEALEKELQRKLLSLAGRQVIDDESRR